MQDEESSAKYRQVLDELQVQSWQLELLSQILPFLACLVPWSPYRILRWQNSLKATHFNLFFISTIYITCIIAIFNLILHLLLRGLWMISGGIRSVSRDIDFDQLNIAKIFNTHLKALSVLFTCTSST